MKPRNGPSRIPLRVGARGGEFVPASKAVNEVQRPNRQQFTLTFSGPRALYALRACEEALSPCTFKVEQIGAHSRISFDSLPARRRFSGSRR